jgi:psiF repeat
MLLATVGTLALLSTGVGYAQTAAPAAKTETPSKVAKPRTAKSLECSKEADAKGLHGEERKKFRNKCKKG